MGFMGSPTARPPSLRSSLRASQWDHRFGPRERDQDVTRDWRKLKLLNHVEPGFTEEFRHVEKQFFHEETMVTSLAPKLGRLWFRWIEEKFKKKHGFLPDKNDWKVSKVFRQIFPSSNEGIVVFNPSPKMCHLGGTKKRNRGSILL